MGTSGQAGKILLYTAPAKIDLRAVLKNKVIHKAAAFLSFFSDSIINKTRPHKKSRFVMYYLPFGYYRLRLCALFQHHAGEENDIVFLPIIKNYLAQIDSIKSQ